MRVISGEAKGRRLVAPAVPGLRPTSDRVKEAIFDILEARNLVDGGTFLDLFAGSGGLGVEALSRGATGVTFVERDRRAAAAIEQNLRATGYLGAPGVRVVRADVLSWVAAHGREVAGVVLADPPYDFAGWDCLLGSLEVPVAVVEHRGPLGGTGKYAVSREYRYGGTLVTLLHQAGPSEGSGEERPHTDEDPA